MHLESYSAGFHRSAPIFLEMGFFRLRSVPKVQPHMGFEMTDPEGKAARYAVIHLCCYSVAKSCPTVACQAPLSLGFSR